MHIISVIPIAKGIFKDELSYFSAKDIAPGSIVTIPVKSKLIKALVTHSAPASDLKAELKASDFKLKKIAEVVTTGLFTEGFLAAARATAAYHAASPGQVIKSLTPKAILDHLEDLPPVKVLSLEPTPINKIHHTHFALQEPDLERLAFYKSLIREAFAKQSSVFFCLPSASDMASALPILAKGIADYTFILHPGLSGKTIRDIWQKVLETDHPVLIVATPIFLSIPRSDLRTIIIDKENTSFYKTISRPKIDARVFAESFAEKIGGKFIIGDTALRTETIYRVERNDLVPASPIKYRSFTEAKQKLINSGRQANQEFIWQPIHPEVAELITAAEQKSERTVIFTGRRGIAPITLCRDCGTTVTCGQCQSPLVVHSKKTKSGQAGPVATMFMCHKCQRVEDTDTVCKYCRSWRLESFGAGIDKIKTEVETLCPKGQIFILDSDAAPTAKIATEIVTKFLATPGGILIGTEMILYHLHEKVEQVIALSFDSLFMLPDFRIREKVFVNLIRLRDHATKSFAIQTKNPDEPIFDKVLKGNLLDFYREELAEREQFNYPPFCRLIKISREGLKADVLADMEALEKVLVDYEPLIFPAFIPTIKGRYRLHALLRLPLETWKVDHIKPELLAILKHLPPSYEIGVDPEDIL